MSFIVEYEREGDGRWIAEVMIVPGAMAYGHSVVDAIVAPESIARPVLAYRRIDEVEFT